MRLPLLFAGIFLGICLPSSAALITPEHAALAARYSRAHGGLCLLVEQNGQIIYRDESGLSLDAPHRIYSGTKNFVALTALAAAQEGLLRLDEPASLTLTEWQHDARRAITIRQLLNQTSGLDPSAEMIGDSRDQMAAAVRARLIAEPGTRFHYGPANYQAMGEILRRKLAGSGRSVEDYMHEKIFDPLDVDIASWYRDRAGHPVLHAGIQLSAEEWKKVGDFLIRASRLGNQASHLQRVDQLFTGTFANPAYGLSFWLNRPETHNQPMRELQVAMDGEQLDAGGPRDLFAAEGSDKQRLYVIPSLNLVVVRFAEGARYSDGDFLSRLLTGRPNPDARVH